MGDLDGLWLDESDKGGVALKLGRLDRYSG
jgi:hypothetical protein